MLILLEVLLFSNNFAVWVYFIFHMNLLSNSLRLSWWFDNNCIKSIHCFWYDCHFPYVNSTNTLTWKIFPHSNIFFNLFFQRLDNSFHTGVSLSWLQLNLDTLYNLFLLWRVSFVKRRAITLFELILYPATLVNVFIHR